MRVPPQPAAHPSSEPIPESLAAAPVHKALDGAVPEGVAQQDAQASVLRRQKPPPAKPGPRMPASQVQEPPDSRKSRWCFQGAAVSTTPDARYSACRLQLGVPSCQRSSEAWELPEVHRNSVARQLLERGPPGRAAQQQLVPQPVAVVAPEVLAERCQRAGSTGHPGTEARQSRAHRQEAEHPRKRWRTRHGRVAQEPPVPS